MTEGVEALPRYGAQPVPPGDFTGKADAGGSQAAAPAAQFSDITFGYGRRRAPVISGLSASFGPSSTVLLGPNGAGKSTLLRLMAGHLRPQRGQLHATGVVAFSPQSPVALPGFTVFDQVKYAGWLGGLPLRQTQAAAEKSLEAVGLAELVGRGTSSLSGGERARLGIACALTTSPTLLLLDEPSAALDPVARESVRTVLCRLSSSGVCIVATSHTAVDIGAPFERLLVLDGGMIVFDGTPGEFLDGNHENATVETFSRALRAGR